MRSALYVDGFNLYNGSLRYRPELKWLDLVALARQVLPNDELVKVRFFTAKINVRDDPGAPGRQKLYWLALRTQEPLLELHEGKFASRKRRMPLAAPQVGTVGARGFDPSNPVMATVRRTDEKGSDVNLASYLLLDAFSDSLDRAVVVSNDTDLIEPIRIVREMLGRQVIVLNPHLEQYSAPFATVADTYRPLEPNDLLASQFPDEVALRSGATIHRPPEWAEPAATSAGGPTIEISEGEGRGL